MRILRHQSQPSQARRTKVIMSTAQKLMTAMLVFTGLAPHNRPDQSAERALINENRSPAGQLRAGVLTIRLEAREVEWHPDGDDDPGILVRAFAEEGKTPSIPGPLIRVPEGTEIRALVRNPLADTLGLHGFFTRDEIDGDSVIYVPPGETREARFYATVTGTYYYRGSIGPDEGMVQAGANATLNGAFVVDPRGTRGPARDRVLVLGMWTARGTAIDTAINRTNAIRFTVNGKSWPHTERLSYAIGDSIHFRVINPSLTTHPMHLHGFYFTVRSRGDQLRDRTYDRADTNLAVTESLTPGRTFSMSFVPDRAGNWLFHCHDNLHVKRNQPLDGSRLPPEHTAQVENHALEMMGGLVIGIEIRPRTPGARATTPSVAPRRLRLLVQADTGGTELEPAYRYVVEGGAQSPTMVLKRGEPVAITVVNRLNEPTAVHWHGMELDSYFDGVPGFAGQAGRIAPLIAPRDSFEARFTPPRAGTFMYHPHADEVRQQQAGLAALLLVVDDPAQYDAAHDIPLLITVPRRNADGSSAVLINGRLSPAPLTMRVGERYRLRIADLHTSRALMRAQLLSDTTAVSWRALAKDGMTLPRTQATVRPATQQIGNGETYDFEFTPVSAGELRFLVSTEGGTPLATQIVRVN